MKEDARPDAPPSADSSGKLKVGLLVMAVIVLVAIYFASRPSEKTPEGPGKTPPKAPDRASVAEVDSWIVPGAMPEPAFWALVEKARNDKAEFLEAMRKQLHTIPVKDIVAFDRMLVSLERRAYRWNLWAAANLINGGCSDDGFVYFRRWLVAQGRKAYRAALANPDSLIDVAPEDEAELEEFGYVPCEVYQKRTGKKNYYKDVLGDTGKGPSEPAGKPWKERDLKRLFPRLWAKYGEP